MRNVIITVKIEIRCFSGKEHLSAGFFSLWDIGFGIYKVMYFAGDYKIFQIKVL